MISVLSWPLLHGLKSQCERYTKNNEGLDQQEKTPKPLLPFDPGLQVFLQHIYSVDLLHTVHQMWVGWLSVLTIEYY